MIMKIKNGMKRQRTPRFNELTSGICDNCIIPKMMNTGGDGVNEPN